MSDQQRVRPAPVADSGWARAVTAGLLIGAFILAVGAGALSRSTMSSSSRTMTATTAELPSAGVVEMVVEVETLEGGLADTRLLAKTGDQYSRTDEHVRVALPSGVPIVMGTAGDVRAGAVLHIRGEKRPGDGAIVVDRIVVLTDSVRLD